MNFEWKIKFLEEKIRSNLTELKVLKKRLREAKKFTAKFLNECAKQGIKEVGIGKIPPSVKDWPFSGNSSVFGIGRDKNGWPAIWGVVHKLGISCGAGNTDQHQADTSNLIDGIYKLKQGKWIRLKEVSDEKTD